MEMPPKRALVGLSGRFWNFSSHRVVTTQSLLHYTAPITSTTPRRSRRQTTSPPQAYTSEGPGSGTSVQDELRAR